MKTTKEVIIDKTLNGTLTIPDNPQGLVIFAHGSGSSRFSRRNQHVANILVERHMATLLMDLLTPEEDIIDQNTREFRFDISLLAERLVSATQWMKRTAQLKNLSIGYFGSSTGAAAALIAAAILGDEVNSVVSRGGRPDLALEYLPKVKAPTLLIVGGDDHGVIELNETAFALLRGIKKLEIVPGATHLFEEEGKLDIVAHLAASWFQKSLFPKAT